MLAHKKKLIVQGVVTSAWWRLRCVQCEVRVRVHALVWWSHCCLHSLFSPCQLASENLLRQRSVGPSHVDKLASSLLIFLGVSAGFHPIQHTFRHLFLHLPCIKSLSPYLLFSLLVTCPHPEPQGTQLLSVFVPVRLSVSTLFPTPAHHLSLSLSNLSLSLQMSPPVSLSCISSISQKHPYYFQHQPYITLKLPDCLPNPSHLHVPSDSMFFSMLPPDLCLSKRDPHISG